MVQIEDLVGVHQVGGLVLPEAQLSPDGRWVAYTVRRADVDRNGYDATLHITATSAADTITVAEHPVEPAAIFTDAFAPRWAPDSMSLAYVESCDGQRTLMRYEIASRTSTRLDIGPAKLDVGFGGGFGGGFGVISDYRWAPDGRSIALLINRPPEPDTELPLAGVEVDATLQPIGGGPVGGTVLQLLDPASGVLRAISPETLRVTSFDWSPDSRRLVLSAVPAADRNRFAFIDASLYVVDTQTATAQPLVTQAGWDRDPVWSPDGRYIAFLSQTGTRDLWYRTTLAVVSSEGGAVSYPIPAEFRRSCANASFRPGGLYWSADSASIRFAADYKLGRHLLEVPRQGGAVRIVTDDTSRTFASFSFSRDGTTMAFVAQGVQEPAEVFVSDTALYRPHPITDVNAHRLDTLKSTVERIAWVTPTDGVSVHGLLIKPPAFTSGQRYPLVVFLQGGPGMVAQDFNVVGTGITPAPLLVLADRGYLVLVPNTRGRPGYGDQFRNAMRDQRSYGSRPFEDVMAGVDALIDQGMVDPGQMGVAGWSYGGYLTALTITKTARFKAAVVGEAVGLDYLDQAFHALGDDTSETFWRDREGARSPFAPGEREHLEEQSPIHNTDKVSTPTLLQAGANSLLAEAAPFYGGLKHHGVPSVLISYPRSGHGIEEPKLQLDAMSTVLHWFDYWVRDLPYPDADKQAAYDEWKRAHPRGG